MKYGLYASVQWMYTSVQIAKVNLKNLRHLFIILKIEKVEISWNYNSTLAVCVYVSFK